MSTNLRKILCEILVKRIEDAFRVYSVDWCMIECEDHRKCSCNGVPPFLRPLTVVVEPRECRRGTWRLKNMLSPFSQPEVKPKIAFLCEHSWWRCGHGGDDRAHMQLHSSRPNPFGEPKYSAWSECLAACQQALGEYNQLKQSKNLVEEFFIQRELF